MSKIYPDDYLEVIAHASPWSRTIELMIYRGRKEYASEIQFSPIPEGTSCDSPTVRLGYEAAQQLMDSLWQSGLRPTEGAGSAGSLEATQKHLEDMRSLVFERLPKTQAG